jgi:hypothetical protein
VVGVGATWDIRGAANRCGPYEIGMGDMRGPGARKEQTHDEFLAALAQLDVRERRLRATRANITYDLEQVIGERMRLQRDLDSSEERSA